MTGSTTPTGKGFLRVAAQIAAIDPDESSDSLESEYVLAANQDSAGRIIEEDTESERKRKSEARYRAFYRTLGKHWVCLLPDENAKFDDGLPHV